MILMSPWSYAGGLFLFFIYVFIYIILSSKCSGYAFTGATDPSPRQG